MKTIDPKSVETAELHSQLLASIAPRPIAFASTLDENGTPNLSPFSFFNVFSANPPIAIFSPARRVRNNTTKHTLDNVKINHEVVINVVSYSMVEQMSLSSTEYPKGINEFDKSGFTPLASEKIAPPRVAEAPVQLECKVKEVVELGAEGGAGNLVICEVVLMHIDESVLNDQGKIDQHKIDLVGRLGGDWYVRASGEALFEVAKPLRTMGIGVDSIPKRIAESPYLTGNDLGKLGNVEKLPTLAEIENFANESYRVKEILNSSSDGLEAREALHQLGHEMLEENKVEKAWKVLLVDKLNRL